MRIARDINCETFYHILEVGLRKTTERTEDTEEKSNALCPQRLLGLIFFAITREFNLEEIKKCLNCGCSCCSDLW